MPVVENKDKKTEEVSPQIIEMQQTIQELTTRLEKGTTALADQTKEIEEMRAANVKAVSDKLAKEKDLKDAFGVKNAAPKKTPEDINSMSNTDMLEVIADAVEGMVDATRQEAEAEMTKGFKNLDTKFDSVVGHIMKKEADIALQTARTDNKDFDEHHDTIREILKQHQEFTYQDAYDWMKMKEAKGVIAKKHVETEKPDKDLSSADEAVSRIKKQSEGKRISRRRQFKDSLDAAIERVQARRGGQ